MTDKQGNKFDKILKENITSVSLPFLEKLLGASLEKTVELKDKLQVTLEGEPDFLRIVKQKRKKDFVLHLEFQAADDPQMLDRIGLTYYMVKRRYKLYSTAYVLYFGKKPSKMRTQSLPDEPFLGSFKLISLRDHSYKKFLASDIPEELVLAICSDFEGKKPSVVIRMVIERLEAICQGQKDFKIKLRQFAVS